MLLHNITRTGLPDLLNDNSGRSQITIKYESSEGKNIRKLANALLGDNSVDISPNL